jgi:hypothetical protein
LILTSNHPKAHEKKENLWAHAIAIIAMIPMMAEAAILRVE